MVWQRYSHVKTIGQAATAGQLYPRLLTGRATSVAQVALCHGDSQTGGMTAQRVPVDDLARVRDLTLSGRAREIRETARVSKGELARWVGCSQPAITRWESGERKPTGRLAVAYLKALERLQLEGAGRS